ncbi:hypothetical protein C8R46DRAFT_1057579 [Mycena filopes]|nr:hypothetical protein C8R46DRAFT_1057579 [Mycena filopes]
MTCRYQLRVGGSYALETHLRFLPTFKISGMKFTKTKTERKRTPGSGKVGLGGARAGNSDDEVPPPRSLELPIREGAMRVKVTGVHPRSCFFKPQWVVLCEKQLEFHSSPTKPACSSILLSDIEKLERTDRLPYGLALQTKHGQHYLLGFENDRHLYEWQDDIASRSMGVSPPYNFVHEIHAGYDSVNGNLTGLPPGWEESLTPSMTSSTSNPAAEEISLRVKLRVSLDEWYLCTVLVPPQITLQEVLPRVCSQMAFPVSNYDLALPGQVEPLASHLTLEALEGKHEIVLVKQPTRFPPPPPSFTSTSSSGEYRDLILAVITPEGASPRRPPPYQE